MKCFLAAAVVLALAMPAQALTMEEAGREQKAQAAAPGGQAPAAGTQECGDDERLLNIEEWLGKEPQKPLVTITPSTFIQLDQEIRQRIGAGQMLICPKTPVAKGGRPVKKVAVPFQDIMTAIESAVAADDEAAIKDLLKSYTAAPLPPEEVVPMAAANLPWNGTASEKVLKGLGIDSVSTSIAPEYRLIQVFDKFGGKSTSRANVLCVKYAKELADKPKGDLGVAYGEHAEEACRILQRTGLNVVIKK